ncbi:serine/threonine-protein kinase [Streptomonospora nanhaiensis]|uniref:serine/threonine-protein kinase n=1 Tax=Streptomonospora nanhaiensis TaxID=1323731 RepID=UPI001C38ABDD|nr:serine/threonine-protein kinase [Streptomonospora nanhaiensis]MBV2362903.1 serine/threonine protein kinase [Streptomonospora nanhaiensis]
MSGASATPGEPTAPHTGAPAPAPPAAPLPVELSPLRPEDPRTVGPYRVIGRIGAGGMGAVYGGLDEHGRCLAVKTVHAEHAADPGFRAAFAREVALLRRANGVCTAAVHAADPDAPSPWVATDYIPGRNLHQHVRQVGTLDGAMLRAFAAGTAEALAAVHAAGIVHRDVKPGNVILAPDGPKIVDFGIATAPDDAQGPDAAASYGTPGWVAPERYRGAPAAPPVDVFAWGGLVVLAATGRAPFGTGTPAELKERVLTGEPDLDGVPEDLLPLVERALAKRPEDRPAALEAFTALLDLVSDAEGADAAAGGLAERTRPLADRLRSALARYWHGVDAGWHEPALWAAAAGITLGAGAAAAGATVAGAAALAGAAGGAGASGTGAGGTAGGAGALGGLGGLGGTGAGGAATQGATGIALGKIAAATATIVVGGGVVAGGIAGYTAWAGPSPEEAVQTAAQHLEQGRGFSAEVVRQYTAEYAEQEAAAQGVTPEELVEQSRSEMVYSYAGGERPVFLASGYFLPGDESTRGRGVPQESVVAVANVDGAVYVYGTVAEDPLAEPTDPADLADPADYPAAAYGPQLIGDSLASLAESGELAEQEEPEQVGGSAARVYSGPMTAQVLSEGRVERSQTTGRLWVDPETGQPLRLEHTHEEWEVRIDFTAVDEAVEVSDPQPADTTMASQDALPQVNAVIVSPVCGRVEAEGASYEVRPQVWDMSCPEAMDLAESFAAGEGEMLMDYSGTGVQTLLIGEYACEQITPSLPEGGHGGRMLGNCTTAEPVEDPGATGFSHHLGTRPVMALAPTEG